MIYDMQHFYYIPLQLVNLGCLESSQICTFQPQLKCSAYETFVNDPYHLPNDQRALCISFISIMTQFNIVQKITLNFG